MRLPHASHLVFACVMAVCGHAAAEQRVWLIGSGPGLDNTQVQIERNLLWVRATLESLPGTRRIDSFFTDGDDPAPDITLWQPVEESAATLQPLARVYDTYYLNGEAVRSHRIDALRGAATRQNLRAALRDDLAGLPAGSDGILVYVGHGSRMADESRLDLWGGVPLTASDMQDMLAAQPVDTRLRLVFAQCYAGGFHAAVMAADGAVERCGFYAVAADQPAEGCTVSLDAGDYRGYSTYFFAALAGQARTGGALPFAADRDGDARVDPYEAHLYSLRAARSLDIPRSSSEQFLLDWEPWYLPLLRVETVADNVYAQVARDLFDDLGLQTQDTRLKPALLAHRKVVQAQVRRMLYRREQARDRAAGAREQLQRDLESRWPSARYPYTLAYRDFLRDDLDTAQAFIQEHPLYRDLVADQDEYWKLDAAILELQRRLAQLDRIDHLLRLARLQTAFAARADSADRDRYQRLLDCERQPL